MQQECIPCSWNQKSASLLCKTTFRQDKIDDCVARKESSRQASICCPKDSFQRQWRSDHDDDDGDDDDDDDDDCHDDLDVQDDQGDHGDQGDSES